MSKIEIPNSKAITLWQPWASLVALGYKKIETRSWRTDYRGPLAIHAAAKRTKEGQAACYHNLVVFGIMQDNGLDLYDMPYGSIIATCNLVDCVEITPAFAENLTPEERALGDYTPGRYAWILRDVRELPKPIRAKGRQRLWNWQQETTMDKQEFISLQSEISTLDRLIKNLSKENVIELHSLEARKAQVLRELQQKHEYTETLIEHFINSIHNQYPDQILVQWEWDEDNTAYYVWHDNADLQYNSPEFLEFVGVLISDMFIKNSIYGIAFGYDYNKTQEDQSEVHR